MNPTSDQLLRIVWSQFWQVSLLIVVVGGLAHTVCRRRPHMAHLLWILVIVKCLTPAVWSSPLGVFSWAQAESVAATTAVKRFDLEDWLLGSMFGEVAPVSGARPEAQFVAAEPPVTWSMAGVLVGVWLAGAAGLTLLTGLNWWTSYHALRQSHVTPDPALTSVLQRLADRLGLRRPVRLLVTSRPLGPAVFGLLPSQRQNLGRPEPGAIPCPPVRQTSARPTYADHGAEVQTAVPSTRLLHLRPLPT